MVKHFFSSFFAPPLALPDRRTELEVITVFATDDSAIRVKQEPSRKIPKNWSDF